jgi:uracil-DNA glycosylase
MLSIEYQDKTIEQIVEECPPVGWIETFEKANAELKVASQILATRFKTWFPLNKNIFRAFDLCPLNNVKVVILGQDPYHSVDNGHCQANGLAFSTDRGHPVQPSLKNIYKELAREYPDSFVTPDHGDLSSWASQGVLLLNTCLTVNPHQAASHMSKDKKGSFWNGFITRVIDGINKANPQCIFMLWGSFAINFSQGLLNSYSIKLYASHPSPFSANKASKDAPAFIGCNHFILANEALVKQGKTTIDWTLK